MSFLVAFRNERLVSEVRRIVSGLPLKLTWSLGYRGGLEADLGLFGNRGGPFEGFIGPPCFFGSACAQLAVATRHCAELSLFFFLSAVDLIV